MCDNKIRGLIAPFIYFFIFDIYFIYMNKARKSLSEEVIAMINNNDRFVIDGYDNKIIESVVKNLAEIVSKYIPKTDNRIYGYIGNNNKE